jgi:hypothetical protein
MAAIFSPNVRQPSIDSTHSSNASSAANHSPASGSAQRMLMPRKRLLFSADFVPIDPLFRMKGDPAVLQELLHVEDRSSGTCTAKVAPDLRFRFISRNH